MSELPKILAIDYGTSNSLVAAASESELLAPIPIDDKAKDASILRSVLFYPDNKTVYFGQKAIDQYTEQDCEGRLFRSVKKYLLNPAFVSTQIGGKPYLLEDIISTFLREMRTRANKRLGTDISDVVLGRPALFSMQEDQHQLAIARLEKAAKKAGFKSIDFFPEPLAAAFEYRSTIQIEKILLVVDLGGGTSDFTVMKVSPEDPRDEDVLALGGISVAGDAMDGALMTGRLSAEFASEVSYRPALSKNILEMPIHIKDKLSSAPDIALMTEADIMRFIKEVERTTLNEEDSKKVKRLISLVEDNLGFRLYELIEAAKRTLGVEDRTRFYFPYPDIELDIEIEKSTYDEAVTENIDKIMKTMDETVKSAGLSYKDIDIVCATGGTSKIPKIKEELFKRLSQDKIDEFRNFHSVIQGLNRQAQSLLK